MPGVNVIDLVNKGKIRLVRDGIPIGVVGILALMGKNVNVLSDPSFKLEYVDSEE